ncbi:hypothetical protein MCEROE11_01296 [Candidatus Nanopelagicaceae bacterium]
MTPKKPDWFEMTEGDTPATGLRKVNKTLPIGALLVAGALLFGGSLFAQDQSADSNIASSSVAEAAHANTTTDSNPSVQSVVAVQTKTASITAATVNSLGVPTIAPVVGISSGDDDDEDDDEDDDGDHRGGRGHDDDDDEDEDDD